MKKFIPVFVVTLAIVLFFNGKKYDDLVNSRLSSSIAVCLEGQSCGQATAMNVAEVGGARSAESIYTTGCAACHDNGGLNFIKDILTSLLKNKCYKKLYKINKLDTFPQENEQKNYTLIYSYPLYKNLS